MLGVARSRPIRTALAAAALAAVLAGCGSSGRAGPAGQQAAAAGARTTSSPAAVASTAPTGGTVRVADCRLWRVLGPADRRALVVAMRNFFGGSVDSPGLRGSSLPDAKAIAAFDAYCRLSFTSAFKLYKIYGRAAAFSGGASGA